MSNIQYQNHLKNLEVISFIHQHHKHQDIYIGYKDRNLTIQQATENIVLAAGFTHAEQISGLSDHDLPYPSVLLAEDYIFQDKKVLTGMKLTIFDILPLKGSPVLTMTTRIPVTDCHYKIIGAAFFMHRIYENAQLKELAKIILCNNNKKGASLILHEENILSSGNEYYSLNEKEFEVLWLLSRGLSPKKIAQFLLRSPRTIEEYINKIKDKFGCHHKSELVEYAINLGILHYLPISLARGAQA